MRGFLRNKLCEPVCELDGDGGRYVDDLRVERERAFEFRRVPLLTPNYDSLDASTSAQNLFEQRGKEGKRVSLYQICC